MGYFMRYFIADEQIITIETIAHALKQADSAFNIQNTFVPDIGEIYHGEIMLGDLEISRPNEEIFTEEIEEYRDLLKYSRSPNKQRVLDVLEAAQAIVAVEVMWEGDDPEPALALLDDLWDWLFATYAGGLLQADGEGFYDGDELILEMAVTG